VSSGFRISHDRDAFESNSSRAIKTGFASDPGAAGAVGDRFGGPGPRAIVSSAEQGEDGQTCDEPRHVRKFVAVVVALDHEQLPVVSPL